MKAIVSFTILFSFLALSCPLYGVTLTEADLGQAELAMNEDNLSRFMKTAMKSFDQPHWFFLDGSLAFDPSVTTNYCMDYGLGDQDWGAFGYLFGLTVYVLNMRQAYFMDLGPYYGFSLTQKDTLGANFFNGINLYGKGWKVFTGVDFSLTPHSRVGRFPLSLYFFSDFSLLSELIKPYLDIAIPADLTNLFSRIAAGVKTPFGSPGFRSLKTIGGINYTASYTAQLFPLPMKTVELLDVTMDGITLDLFLARSFDVLQGEDFLKKFSDGKAQVFVSTLSFMGDEETEGRFFFSLHYTGLDGFGFQAGLESDKFALILSKNAFLEGYYGTTLGLFSLYGKWVLDLNDLE